MSHFTEVKVEFKTKNEQYLVDALKEIFGADAVTHAPEGGLKIRNYAGKILNSQEQQHYGKASNNCTVIVKREALEKWNTKNGVFGYESDIGFEKQEDGTYKVYADNTGSFSKNVKNLKNLVTQEYTYRVTEATMKKQGYFVKRKVDQKSGSIQLIASKYA